MFIRLAWHDSGMFKKSGGGNAALRINGKDKSGILDKNSLEYASLFLKECETYFCPVLMSKADLWV